MDASNRRQQASEEATEWLVVLQGDQTQAQREQFIDWLRESPVHVAEMLRMAQIHGALEQFERWARIPTNGAADDDDAKVIAISTARTSKSLSESRKSGVSILKHALPLTAILAAAAVALVAVLPHWRGTVIETDRAERREVALADGSVVQLDPETKLRIIYEDHARRVILERGRALFHVAKNKERPFLVKAQNTTVRAVGTAFGVEQQSESILVTVAEGKVEIIPPIPASSLAPNAAPGSKLDQRSSDERSGREKQGEAQGEAIIKTDHGAFSSIPSAPQPKIFLTANQQIVVERSGSADAMRTVDSGRALAWAEGRLVFESTTLADAVAQFNKYNSIQLTVHDAALGGRPINGVFNASDPESFVAFIQSVVPVRVSRTAAADIELDPAN